MTKTGNSVTAFRFSKQLSVIASHISKTETKMTSSRSSRTSIVFPSSDLSCGPLIYASLLPTSSFSSLSVIASLRFFWIRPATSVIRMCPASLVHFFLLTSLSLSITTSLPSLHPSPAIRIWALGPRSALLSFFILKSGISRRCQTPMPLVHSFAVALIPASAPATVLSMTRAKILAHELELSWILTFFLTSPPCLHPELHPLPSIDPSPFVVFLLQMILTSSSVNELSVAFQHPLFILDEALRTKLQVG
ncbi:hypothetical protein SISSUDRAFT_395684 [Sistotremastrum suecicum HHB10207 ss-3]|uniref:Uncharacterized protein n=1 Tax=Sistotremastrum suecicum HHB10207 ss-3 TaxID=1314776 RepID=A0A165YV73_9AGAM|nr:hypothetical protein SISSUDRAFT_395684 [Sistotremastrum suecicum HHB10207 ss-3]